MAINTKRNLELDRLRGFAVMMTVLIHYTRVFFPWDIEKQYVHGTTVLNLLHNTWTGVDLFLVISGYIISKVIVEKIDSLKQQSISLSVFIKNFYIKRFFRIYPIAWLVFLIVLFCTIFFNHSGYFGTTENTLEAGISIFTYTFNYYFGEGFYHAFTLSPYWSLSLEEQFYLLLPLFLVFTKTTRQRVTILLGVLLLITFVIRPLSPDNIFLTQNRSDGLIYGCLLYYLSAQNWFHATFSITQVKKRYSIAITCLLIAVLASITAIGFSDIVVIPLACLIAVILVGLSSLEKGFIAFFPIAEGVVDYIGSRSYSIYIIHFPIFTVTQEIGYRLSHQYHFSVNSELALPYSITALLLTIICSELSYRFIEQPLIKKGRRITDNLTLKPQQVQQQTTVNTVLNQTS